VDYQILEEERIAEERSRVSPDLGNRISEEPLSNLTSLRHPHAVEIDATAAEAIDKMMEHRIGCVLVVDGGRLVGVFTERDVLGKIAAEDRSPRSVPVRDVMTPDPECLTLEDSLAYALHLMSVGGFRHIPLVDDDGRPTAVIPRQETVDFLPYMYAYSYTYSTGARFPPETPCTSTGRSTCTGRRLPYGSGRIEPSSSIRILMSRRAGMIE
jgi:CBS domain-containing protein